MAHKNSELSFWRVMIRMKLKTYRFKMAPFFLISVLCCLRNVLPQLIWSTHYNSQLSGDPNVFLSVGDLDAIVMVFNSNKRTFAPQIVELKLAKKCKR